MIERLDPKDFGELTRLEEFSGNPLLPLPDLPRERSAGYWHAEIEETISDESATGWVAKNGDGIEAFAIYTDAPWDSKVTGAKVGFVRHLAVREGTRGKEIVGALLTELSDFALRRGTKCLTAKVRALDSSMTHALEENGFLLMDTSLNFLCDFSRTTSGGSDGWRQPDGLTTRRAEPKDEPEVLVVSEKAFTGFFGRYHADPRMPAGAAVSVYRDWILSAFRGWADWILVAEIDRRIVGYGIWKKPSRCEVSQAIELAHYSLAGVHPDFAGRGIYSALARDGMQIARAEARFVDGPVHVSNFPVHRALHRLGWKIADAKHSFHKWLVV